VTVEKSFGNLLAWQKRTKWALMKALSLSESMLPSDPKGIVV
jgi:hypothetical protein